MLTCVRICERGTIYGKVTGDRPEICFTTAGNARHVIIRDAEIFPVLNKVEFLL